MGETLEFVAVVAGIALAVVIAICGIAFAIAQYNRHYAPMAFAQCAQLCGQIGVHRADPDFKCECNETKRIEGHPSIDLNLSR
jgi:hypothetical protein